MRKLFSLAFIMLSVSTVCAANDTITIDRAFVDGASVVCQGKMFFISVFNQETAENEINNAKAVYAFQIVDFNLNQGNTGEEHIGLYNPRTSEYAVTNYVKYDDKIIRYAIIFSENGAKLIKDVKFSHLEGFQSSNKIGYTGYCAAAGYASANLNGVHNSVIVYIR